MLAENSKNSENNILYPVFYLITEGWTVLRAPGATKFNAVFVLRNNEECTVKSYCLSAYSHRGSFSLPSNSLWERSCFCFFYRL